MRRAGLAIASLAIVAGCQGRAPQEGDATTSTKAVALDVPAVVEIDLTKGAPESVPQSLFGPTGARTHFDLVRALDATRDAATTKAVFVRLGAGTGLARAAETGRLLAAIRKKEIPVVCHADDYSNASMLLAALGCDKIWVSPAGGVDAVGIAAQLFFANKLLTKLHIDVDFLQIGKYKGAEEPFTRDDPSPEARESLEGTLRGMRAAWLEGLGKRSKAVADAAEDGPFTADEAKAKGFVDEIGYADEARDAAKKAGGVDQVQSRFGGFGDAPPVSRGLVGVLRAISGAGHVGTPHVAVVRAVGAISMGGGGGGLPLGGSDGITEKDLGRMLTKLTNDASTKAVVLRIDSPGGSALASDLLWRKLMKLKEKKPIVVSVGGMAASGGYYLACSGTKILAEPTSIVGSIGVVGGKLAFGKALEEIGVHGETVAATPDKDKAARAAYMSPLSPWDDVTRAKVRASMQAIYDLFLKRVAEGRGIPVEKVATFAEGRIFAGSDAKDRGMVDDLGGLEEAIDLALKLAKLPDDAPVDALSETPGFLEMLDQDDDEARAAFAREELAASARAAVASALAPEWARIGPELGTFLAAASPLADGERALTALPFGLVVR